MKNYLGSDTRETPVNLGVARMLLSALVLWKLVHYEWSALSTWPTPILEQFFVFRHPLLMNHIEFIVVLCGISLVSVFVGYRIRLTAWISAVLVTYLGSVRHVYQISHSSRILFNAALILVLFAVFADEDKLSVDQLRRTRRMSLESLSRHLEEDTGRFRHRGLKWGLFVIGMFYFQAGFAKLVFGDPIGWIEPSNLGRYILFRKGDGPSWFLGEFLLQYPVLLFGGAVLTIVLEAGFLPYALSGRNLWPFFLGLVGMHLGIVFSVGPVFADQMVLLALFLPWDALQRSIQRGDDLTIVYDRHCFLCARSLYLFRLFDVADSVSYYDQDTVPDRWDETDVRPTEAMYAFRGDSAFRGYNAFVQLFKQLGVLAPLALLLRLPGIRHAGRRLYRKIADDRSRYFVCSVND